MPKNQGVSLSVIKRLPRYYRFLGDLLKKDVTRISSRELAQLMQLTASQIRQGLILVMAPYQTDIIQMVKGIVAVILVGYEEIRQDASRNGCEVIGGGDLCHIPVLGEEGDDVV